MIARIEDFFSLNGEPTQRIETEVVSVTLESARARQPAALGRRDEEECSSVRASMPRSRRTRVVALVGIRVSFSAFPFAKVRASWSPERRTETWKCGVGAPGQQGTLPGRDQDADFYIEP